MLGDRAGHLLKSILLGLKVVIVHCQQTRIHFVSRLKGQNWCLTTDRLKFRIKHISTLLGAHCTARSKEASGLMQGLSSVATVCPKVRVNFEVPGFSLICWPIPKPFGMVNPHKLRFGLVYNKPCNVLLTSREYGIKFEKILKEEKKVEILT